ncbi:MAG: hypothetical protein ACJ8AS_07655 [Hyphomicrobiales bacterium]
MIATLPVLPGAAEIRGLVALPKSAMTSAEAAPASTIVSEVPFSAFVQLTTCNSNNTTCFTALPPVPAREQWALQFVSCTVDTAAAATFRDFSVQISDKSVTTLLGLHFVAPTYQSDRQNNVAVYVASQPLVLTAKSGSIVHLVANSIGNMGGGRCALSGVKQKLG